MHELPKNHCDLTYDEIITKAQSIQPHFSADLSKFSDYDPWFSSAINTELLSGIHLGLKDFSEASLHAEITHINDLLDLKLAAARHCYEKLNYYVGTGFRDEITTNQTFGYEGFAKARSSAKKMIPLLNKAHEAILQAGNEDRLVANGMPHGLPIEMVNIAAELATVFGQLKILKKQLSLITRERVELFNSLWDILSRICDSAKIIFEDDPARLAIYELYDIGDLDTQQIEQMEQT